MRPHFVAGSVLVVSVAVFVIQGCAQSPRRTSDVEQLDNQAAACQDTHQSSAPLKSSHLGCLLCTILGRAPIPEGAKGPFFVVPVNPVPNDPPCLLIGLECVLPDTLVFQAPKEPLNHPILLWRIRRDELLLQPIVSAGLAKAATLENQPVIPGNTVALGPLRPIP